ncbi:DUF262 domain-containing protein [Lautropia mirabilis]
MAATNFKTENNTFRKLIGNGLTYRIPRFQRDYSWGEDEWEDLWQDILTTIGEDGDPAHYMGYLVLQSTDDRRFDVIDGQQRLTTLSLIILAVLKNLQRLVSSNRNREANRTRLEQIRQTYIGYLDPVTLLVRPKLTLNRNNNSYYQSYLVSLGHLPKRGFRASEHLLRKAFEWFDRRVENWLKSCANRGSDGRKSSASGTKASDALPPFDEGTRLAQLVEDISDRLFFTVITVSDELNAYKVFETLNARGVRLSSTDLLKNYLFSVLDRPSSPCTPLTYSGSAQYDGSLHHDGESPRDRELQQLEERWESIVGRLASDSFPDFLRIHWNSRHRFARQAELFKAIRSHITDRGQVFMLLREMDEDLDAYLALSSPEVSDWSLENKQLASTLKTFRVRQPLALLLAAHRKLPAGDFTGLLRACVVISLRYNVICSFSTAEQERTYNSVAERIAQGELSSLFPVLQALRQVYVEDRTFRNVFADKTIRTTDNRNGRVVRWLLCAMEKHFSGQDPSFTSNAFDVEHVLPQNAPDGWGGFSNEEAEAMVYRLGNMTLLRSNTNREAADQSYALKRTLYQGSEFAITRRIAEENSEWSPERIAKQQQWMANQATSIWRISQLS